jgi:hypothetical protein
MPQGGTALADLVPPPRAACPFPRAREAKQPKRSRSFLRIDNFLLQNYEIQRNAAGITLLRAALGKQAMQCCEKLRKILVGSQKFGAVSA